MEKITEERQYRPEGMLTLPREFRTYGMLDGSYTRAMLEHAVRSETILTGTVILCDENFTLTVTLGCMNGRIARNEVEDSVDGAEIRDIAVITRVGKQVCFLVRGFATDENGEPYAVLSRKAAQAQCRREYLSKLRIGDIVDAKVTHLEPFGAFVDIGCGIISLLPLDSISVSRITHPRERFFVGMRIAVVLARIEENGRIYVSHKELLGTWEENAALFSPGQTVMGIVRSIESYGVFIELTPNLAGLAEYREGTVVGQNAAVYIKSLIPSRMKVKLVLVDSCHGEEPYRNAKGQMPYFVKDTHIDRWRYSPASCGRIVESVFS